MVAGSNFARKYVVEGAVISYSNWRASRCARPRMTAASEAESRAVPRLLLRPLIIENRLLRSGSRAHPYTTRFLSRMNSGEHCSSERFILLLTSGSLDLLTGSVSIKGYRSRHEPFPRFVRPCAEAHASMAALLRPRRCNHKYTWRTRIAARGRNRCPHTRQIRDVLRRPATSVRARMLQQLGLSLPWVIVPNRLLGAGLRAHTYGARFDACIDGVSQRSAEIFILLLIPKQQYAHTQHC